MKIKSTRNRLLATSFIVSTAMVPLAATVVGSLALNMSIAGAASAQSQSGALRITIQGPNGKALSGATVVIKSPSSLSTKKVVTDGSGQVRVSGLDPATNYSISVSAPGFADFTADKVAVVSGKDLSVGYALAT